MPNVKTTVFRALACATNAFLSAPNFPAAKSHSVLLQKANYAGETEGSLDSEIDPYAQIAAEMAAIRSLAARALVAALVLVALVPAVGVLWFMTVAMRNERLAVQERLAGV